MCAMFLTLILVFAINVRILQTGGIFKPLQQCFLGDVRSFSDV